MITGTVPEFVTVTCCGTPAKVKFSPEGDKVTGPPDRGRPDPVNGIDREESVELVPIKRVADLCPVAEGVNVICSSHVAPAGKPRLDEQVP
jgi:hypothetical protein